MNCEYCNDTKHINDWRTYIRAWREALTLAGNEWMQDVSWKETLEICRSIRDGVKCYAGRYTHDMDCPVCFYH